MISKEDRAYMAGLFEGEGSIHSTIRKPTKVNKYHQRSIVLSISMTDLHPLDLFGDAVGLGSIRGPYSTASTVKSMYEYRLGRFEHVQFVICNIWDWLSPRRREQVEKAFSTYTGYNRGDYR